MKETYKVLKKNGIFIGTVNNRLIYCKNHELIEENYELFLKNMKTGNRYIVWKGQKKGHTSHEFTLEELKKSLLSKKFKIKKILGIYNLLGKYEMNDLKDKQKFIQLQIKFAEKKEYLNNSQDFFFIAQK